MFKQLSFFAALAFILTVGSSAFSKDVSETKFLLREAMMDSNADYNVHKGQANLDEFDRADAWVERDTQVLHINKDQHFVSNTDEVHSLRDLVEQEMSIGQRGLSATDY